MDRIDQANKIYLQNFGKKVKYGRCIFLSWYCDLATCKFCFRSTIKHKIKHAEHAKRTKESVLVEALLCRNLGWDVEFLTGGYGIYDFDDIVEIARLVTIVYGKKIWVNLGALKAEELKKLSPYIEGVVSSIETVEPELHKKVCPDKQIEPYLEMYKEADKLNLKKSMTVVIGLGEKEKDMELLHKFIEDNKLSRITFYALKPIKGTSFTKGPDSDYYAEWIAKTRIRFPKLEIIAGTTARRYEEVGLILKAGANAFTKFPATKLFGTEQSFSIEKQIKDLGRDFVGTLTKLPDIEWDKEIDKLDIGDRLKESLKKKLELYLEDF